MRKMALLVALWFCISTCSAAASWNNDNGIESDTGNSAVFVLPASLKVIDESAFEETAAETVIISDSAEIIGNRAFADIRTLRIIHIPDSVKYIGDLAFEGSLNVAFRGVENSYAAAWAHMHNVAFSQEETTLTWLVKLGKLLQGGFFLSFCLGYICPNDQFWQRKKMENREKSMRPQDRPELYPIDYRFP